MRLLDLRRLASLSLSLLAMLLASSPALAQQVGPSPYVPTELQPWVPWVMHTHDELDCARIGEQYVCEWPGQLQVDVGQERGTFSMRVFVGRRTAVALPGGGRYWPSEVKVDGSEALVIAREDTRPAVMLERGSYTITGAFSWSKPPEVVSIPREVGAVTLQYLGEQIERPRVDEQGRLWIREAGPQAFGEADTLRVSVYRRLNDGVPLKVTTRFELNVAGRARETSLGKVFLEGARPVDARSPLPVQISPEGELKVYVRPGTHQIEIDAYLTSPMEKLAVPKPSKDFFDDQEIWVWEPNEALRSVELSGLLTIDPGRTTLPEDWRGSTTLLAQPGKSLELKTTRRGEVDTPPNQIGLKREIWLDLDGSGYTFRDELSGTMQQGWRLNYGKENGKLGRVQKRGESDALLITRDSGGKGLEGVELRTSALNLEAEVRMAEGLSQIPAVGWEHDVQSLDASLHLPPGWTILATSGVDQIEGTWVDSWNLFEFFLLLMIAFAMGKLFGWPWGVISAVAMVLSHGQPDAPRYVWFHLVAVIALLRVLPDKPYLRYPAVAYLVVSCIALATLFGTYSHAQIRHGLHPQVGSVAHSEYDYGGNADFAGGMAKEEDQSAVFYDEAPAERKLANRMPSSSDSSIDLLSRQKGGKKYKQQWIAQQQQVDPNEVVQTGPGLPDWSWSTWRLKWNGPVASNHTIKLWLVSPFWNLMLRLLSVISFLLMALVVVAPSKFAQRKDDQFDIFRLLKKLAIPALGVVFAAGLVSATPQTAMAQENGQILSNELPVGNQANEIQHMGSMGTVNVNAMALTGSDGQDPKLRQLEARLLEARKCEGACLHVPWMDITLNGANIEIEAEVHAQRDVGWAIPGPASVLDIQEVLLDGFETTRLRRVPGQLIAVRIPKGKHTLSVRAQLAPQNVVTLQLDPFAKPHRVTVKGSGWSVDGLDPYGRPDNSLQLSRRDDDAGQDTPSEPGGSLELPPWYFVERTLMLSLPWQTRTVVRRERSELPQIVKIPLLPGEAVITEGIRVEEGMALVNFPRGESEISYLSELPIPEKEDAIEIALEAPEGKPWTETWSLECSRIWRCGFDGIAPTRTITGGTFMPVWEPWPGESVKITVRKPRGAEGAASTITSVFYEVTPGERRLQASIEIKIRASQGGWQKLTLPQGAEVQEVLIDGAARNIRPEGQFLTLPIKPGEQTVKVRWMQDWDRSFIEGFPEVDLGAKAANVRMRLNLGKKRWLLWAFGPSWGPAVLFWSHIVLLLLIAVLLGRLKHLPLRTHHWLLLSIGMSQLPAIALLPIFLWFSALVWRERRPFSNWLLFDFYQLVLIGMTFIALGTLYAAVHTNLLFDVDMQVRGLESSNHMLNWYTDRVDGPLPEPGVLSVPLLVWRGAMLAWALWLVANVVRWLPWAWRCFSKERFIMRPPEPPAPPARPQGPRGPQGPQGQQGPRPQNQEQPTPGATRVTDTDGHVGEREEGGESATDVSAVSARASTADVTSATATERSDADAEDAARTHDDEEE